MSEFIIDINKCINFKNFYKEELLKCKVWIICALILSISLFVIFIKYNSIPMFICFILSCLFIFIPISILYEKINNTVFKNFILPYLKNNIVKSIVYDNNNKKKFEPSSPPLNRTLGTYWDRWYDVRNVLSGNINNLTYYIADTNTKCTCCRYTSSPFYGQVIELNFNNKIFNNEIYIIPYRVFNKSVPVNFIKINQKNYKFSIYAAKFSNIEIEYLQQIMEFLNLYNKRQVYLHMFDNKILIMIHSNKSFISNFNFFTHKYDYRNIIHILNFIKTLAVGCKNLDQN